MFKKIQKFFSNLQNKESVKSQVKENTEFKHSQEQSFQFIEGNNFNSQDFCIDTASTESNKNEILDSQLKEDNQICNSNQNSEQEQFIQNEQKDCQFSSDDQCRFEGNLHSNYRNSQISEKGFCLTQNAKNNYSKRKVETERLSYRTVLNDKSKKKIKAKFVKINNEVQGKTKAKKLRIEKQNLPNEAFNKINEILNKIKLKIYKRVSARVFYKIINRIQLSNQFRGLIEKQVGKMLRLNIEVDNIISNQISNEPVQSDESFCRIDLERTSKILLVGKAGVGKTRLFNQFQFENNPNQIFNEGIVQEYQPQLIFVDTPSFEFDNSIDERDEKILLFQNYFSNNQNIISTLAILVNFERTDLMKKKINEVLKYTRNIFKKQIIIVVTDWEKSESEDDQQHLEESFKKYELKVLYIRNDFDKDYLKKKFYEAVKYFPNIDLDFQDSLFEVYNDLQEQTAVMMQRIHEQLKKNPWRIEAANGQSSNLFGLRSILEYLLKSYHILKQKFQRRQRDCV